MLPKNSKGGLVEVIGSSDPIALRDCATVAEAISIAMQFASISNKLCTFCVIDGEGKCVLDLDSAQMETPQAPKTK